VTVSIFDALISGNLSDTTFDVFLKKICQFLCLQLVAHFGRHLVPLLRPFREAKVVRPNRRRNHVGDDSLRDPAYNGAGFRG
jgi:hypothetical protein